MTWESATRIELPVGAAPVAPSDQQPVQVIVSLDRDVVEKFKAGGSDWRERMEAVLRAEAIE